MCNLPLVENSQSCQALRNFCSDRLLVKVTFNNITDYRESHNLCREINQQPPPTTTTNKTLRRFKMWKHVVLCFDFSFECKQTGITPAHWLILVKIPPAHWLKLRAQTESTRISRSETRSKCQVKERNNRKQVIFKEMPVLLIKTVYSCEMFLVNYNAVQTFFEGKLRGAKRFFRVKRGQRLCIF